MRTEAQARAFSKYRRNHVLQINVSFYRNTEKEMIAYMEDSGEQKTTLLKHALKEYMGNHPLPTK